MIHTTLKRADKGISGKERKRKEKKKKNWNSDIKQYSNRFFKNRFTPSSYTRPG